MRLFLLSVALFWGHVAHAATYTLPNTGGSVRIDVSDSARGYLTHYLLFFTPSGAVQCSCDGAIGPAITTAWSGLGASGSVDGSAYYTSLVTVGAPYFDGAAWNCSFTFGENTITVGTPPSDTGSTSAKPVGLEMLIFAAGFLCAYYCWNYFR